MIVVQQMSLADALQWGAVALAILALLAGFIGSLWAAIRDGISLDALAIPGIIIGWLLVSVVIYYVGNLI